MARLIGVPKQTGVGGGVRGTMQVLGVPEALIKLGLVNKIARIELGFLAAASARNMTQRAILYCPKITGNLASSIKTIQVAPYTHEVTAASRDGTNPDKNGKEYAGFVEFGTSKMSGRFFMRRAYAETQPEAVAGLALIGRRLEAL